MPRLVRSQVEMEGRFEDIWTLVDEDDDLETWPADAPLTVVGRPAPRQDGATRATGRARYTVDVRLPGMLEAAVLRSTAPFVLYQAGCIHALVAKQHEPSRAMALQLVARALRDQPGLFADMRNDADLTELRDHAAFQRLLAAAEALVELAGK